jgi:hypothetical protein
LHGVDIGTPGGASPPWHLAHNHELVHHHAPDSRLAQLATSAAVSTMPRRTPHLLTLSPIL